MQASMCAREEIKMEKKMLFPEAKFLSVCTFRRSRLVLDKEISQFQ